MNLLRPSPGFFHTPNRLRDALGAFVLVCLVVPAAAQRSAVDANVGVVTADRLKASAIAIPRFDAPADLDRQAASQLFVETIYRNLEISGFFERPRDRRFVEEARSRDRQTGSVDVAQWRRVGAEFLAVGELAAEGNDLTAALRLYEMSRGNRVFGRAYKGFTTDAMRALARRMADDIVFRVTGQRGLASTRICCVAVRGRAKEIAVMAADGGDLRLLTGDNSLALAPAWGMNATEIYFTSYKDRNPDLCGVSTVTGQTWFISRHPGLNVSPAWSPRAKRIVLTLGKDGNSEVYSMDRSGRSLKRLTYNRAIDSSPSWSPAGNRVLFTSNRTGGPQIWVMDADGLSKTRVTRHGDYNDGAVWSPAGDRIAYTSRVGGYSQIFAMNIDGTGRAQLTGGRADNEDPCWSPDGSHLAFTSARDGAPQIWVMNSDGSNQRPLTRGNAHHSAAWSPFFD